MTRDLPEPKDAGPVELLDIAQLGTMLRQQRGSLSLRQAAQEAGVSFSTFSRVEAGSQPDLTSFTLLCAWLGVAPTLFFAAVPAREVEPIELAISHLNNDPRLRPEAAEKITDLDGAANYVEARVDDVLVPHRIRSPRSYTRVGPARLGRLVFEQPEVRFALAGLHGVAGGFVDADGHAVLLRPAGWSGWPDSN